MVFSYLPLLYFPFSFQIAQKEFKSVLVRDWKGEMYKNVC